MSEVRPLSAQDVEAVTALYFRVLRRNSAQPSRALIDYFRSFYLDGPFRDPTISALVHVNDHGRVNGFVGVHCVPYLIGDRHIRAAFCGALMSEDHETDPLAGARLLKAFIAGPQDVSISETANVISETMWSRLRGQAIPGYSFEWFRIFRPAGFATAMAGEKLGFLRSLAPLSRQFDRIYAGKSNLIRHSVEPAPTGLTVEEVDQHAFADTVRQFSDVRTARPDWSNGYLDHVLSTAVEKPFFGMPVMACVKTRSGEPIGGFLYHSKPGGIGRVLQIVAAPDRLGVILNMLFTHAMEGGAVGLRGRTSPDIIAAATGRSMILATISSTVIHARDASVAEPFLSGDCILTGLAGERWNRFFGGNIG